MALILSAINLQNLVQHIHVFFFFLSFGLRTTSTKSVTNK